MTDPVTTTLTASAIATLAFQKFIESGAGELAKKFTETAIKKMDELRQKIRDRLRGNSKAEAAIAALEQGSKEKLEQVTAYLQLEIVEDPQFAAEVRALAHEINIGKLQDNSSMVQNNSGNARGWQTKVEGGTAYIGEINQYGAGHKPGQK
jgi:low affinity Fe/Cu permease